MKATVMMLSAIALTAVLSVQTSLAQETKSPWPGITAKILVENDHVKISEVTFEPGSVADWHDHSDHTVYAVTDIKMKEEMKDKEPGTIEMKAGQAAFAPACTHKVTNVGKKAIAIVTEIKQVPHKH